MSLHGLQHHWEAPFWVRILERIDYENIIDGFEINGDPANDFEHDYMITMATLLKNSNHILQFHCPFNFQSKYDDILYLNKMLACYHNISTILGKELQLVIHPVDSFDIEVAISRTHKFLDNLTVLKRLHHYNIIFALENLNNTYQHKRLNTPEIRTLIRRHPSIKFCWDIGHEVSEGCCDYKLDSSLLRNLKNVHIHDIHLKDHHPFNYEKTDYKRALAYLVSCPYKGSIVTEINIAVLEGNSLLEKFLTYMQNIKLLKDHYKTLQQLDILPKVAE